MGFTTQDVVAAQQVLHMPQPLHSRKRDRSGSLAYSDIHTLSDPRSKPSKRPCVIFQATAGPSSYNEDMDTSSDFPVSNPTTWSVKLEPLDIGITIPASFTPTPTVPARTRSDSQAAYRNWNEPLLGLLSPDPFVPSAQSFPQSLLWKTGPSQSDVPQPVHSRPEHDFAYRPKQIPRSRPRASCVGGGMPCLLHPHRTCTPQINQWTPHQAMPMPPLPSWLSSS